MKTKKTFSVHKIYLQLLVVIAFILGNIDSTKADVVILGQVKKIIISDQFDFIDDASNKLQFNQILSPEKANLFKKLSSPLGRGYTNSTSWLRLDIYNKSSENVSTVLKLSPQMLDNVDVYIAKTEQAEQVENFIHIPLGDHIPRKLKNQKYPIMGVVLSIPSQEKRRLFIRIQTTSSHLLGAELLSKEQFNDAAINTVFWVGGYLALAVGLALITFLQAFRLKDLTHGLYGLLPLGLALNIFGTEGITEILFPNIAHIINDYLVGLSLLFCFGGLSLFSIKLFVTGRNHPWGHRYLQLVIVLAILVFFTSGSTWYRYFVTPINMLALVFWLFLTWAAYKMICRGEKRIGRLFIAAFTLPLLGSAIGLSRYLGWLPQSEFTQYITPATSLIHIVLMTLALSERLLEAESRFREASQRALLELEHQRDQEQLLAMISHEIRNPIAVISAASQSLESLDAEDAPPEKVERYDRIRRSVARLTLLIDLVNMRDIKNDHVSILDYKLIDPLETTNEIVGLLDLPVRHRFDVKFLDSINPIDADLQLVRFAWLNLIENACKYSLPDSPISIEISIVSERGKEGLQWAIQNKGPSIPKNMEEKIFEKYQRGGEYQNITGVGLGLYLARYIMEIHGGTLKTIHQQDGALFVSWLPYYPANRT